MKRLFVAALAGLLAFAPMAALAQPPKPAYVTGSPTTGAIAKASGPQSVTTGDLSGDCTTSGTLAVTCNVASATTLGMAKCDGSTTTCSGGVISAVGGGGGGGAPGASYSTPTLASFTWLNQQSATVTQTVANQAASMTFTNTSQISVLYLSPPATPYRLRAQLVGAPFSGGAAQFGGIGFYDGTKLTTVGAFGSTAGMEVAHLTSVTEAAGTWGPGIVFLAGATFMLGPPMWVQIRNNGTTLFYDMSVDGQNFVNMFSEAIGTFISAPTKIFWAGAGANGTGGTVSLLNWITANNANLN